MNLKMSLNNMIVRARRKSPELLFVGGCIAFGATIVSACRSTLKTKEILDEHKKNLEIVDKDEEAALELVKAVTNDENAELTEENERKVIRTLTIQTGWQMIKTYVLPAALGVLSIACFTKSHSILSKRNAALAGAYTALSQLFKKYREGVIEEYGEEADYKFMHGSSTAKITIDDGKGNVTEETCEIVDGVQNPYVRYLCSDNPYYREYEGDTDNILWWLGCMQEVLNKTMKSRYRSKTLKNGKVKVTPGFISFNEILTATGFDEDTECGLVTGVTFDPHRTDGGDNELKIIATPCKVVNMHGELEDGLALDFNIEGCIYKTKDNYILEK